MLRRILKYTPAAVLGLLVVAWLAGLLGRLSVTYSRPSGSYVTLESASATLELVHRRSASGLSGLSLEPSSGVRWKRFERSSGTRPWGGTFHANRLADCFGGVSTLVHVPAPVVATALLPLAFGALSSFRFRLWHYLAFTALVAVELAYYLRWQS